MEPARPEPVVPLRTATLVSEREIDGGFFWLPPVFCDVVGVVCAVCAGCAFPAVDFGSPPPPPMIAIRPTTISTMPATMPATMSGVRRLSPPVDAGPGEPGGGGRRVAAVDDRSGAAGAGRRTGGLCVARGGS